MGWGSKIKSGLGAVGGKVFGESSNEQLTTQTAAQQALTNNYLNAINSGAAKTIATQQGYADTAYNPYDAAKGDEVYDAARVQVDNERNKQLDAIKGGAMNRFSLGASKSASDINRNAVAEQNDLTQKQLADETNANQTAYGNQQSAINSLTGLGSQLAGMSTFQNQTNANEGWLSKANKVVGLGSNVMSLASGLGSLNKNGASNGASNSKR